MTTTTKTDTNAAELNRADPDTLADVLRLAKLGRMLDPVKITITGLTATAAIDITTLRKGGSGVSIDLGLADLATGDFLPPILDVKTLRVTASGTANTVGSYVGGDTGATGLSPLASTVVGLARISDDGKTLTFLTTMTAFVLEYVPRAATPMTDTFSAFG